MSGIPKDGLVESPPDLAAGIIEGIRCKIVRPRNQADIEPGKYLLLSRSEALGVVRIGLRETLPDEDSIEKEVGSTGVTKGLREEWSVALPSWSTPPWYVWPVQLIEKFIEPIPVFSPVSVGPISKGVVFESVGLREAAEKVKDIDNYDPSKLTDEVLRDDFRICLAWFATWERNPDSFMYSLDTIHTLLKKILIELKRRGPEVITFDPAGMKNSVRGFFLKVAREIDMPKEMFKVLALSTETNTDKLTKNELVAAHWDLHELYSKAMKSPVKGWSTEDIVNTHAKVVDRLYSIGVQQPPPPDNGLDELSADFEDYADEQKIDYYEAPVSKVEKRATMPINRSGNKLGEVIKAADVLSYFKDFKLRMPYIYLVGGLANKGETEGDIDILVNESDEEIAPWLRDVIEFRLGRALPAELSKRLQIHFDRSRGPFTDHIELYNLRCERINPDGEIKEMRKFSNEGSFDSAKHSYTEFQASADNLNDEGKILAALREAAVGPLKSEVIDESSEKFEPQGVTALLLLTTSHIAIHTWPEEGKALLDILTCSSDPDIQGAVKLIVGALEGSDGVEKCEDVEERVDKAIFGSPMGKSHLAGRLIKEIPEHQIYVEPFVGGGQVFFRKELSSTEVISDLDPDIAFAYKYVKTMTEEDCDKLDKKFWIGSRSKFESLLRNTKVEGLDRLHRLLYLKRFSFNNNCRSYAPYWTGTKATMSDQVRRFRKRLAGVHIFNADYEKIIEKYDSKDTFFFLDPPYAGYDTSTHGASTRVYGQKEWSEERFIKVLKGIKGRFLCTYGTRSKKDLFEGFQVKRWAHITCYKLGGKKRIAQSLIITNYGDKVSRGYSAKNLIELPGVEGIFDLREKSYERACIENWEEDR